MADIQTEDQSQLELSLGGLERLRLEQQQQEEVSFSTSSSETRSVPDSSFEDSNDDDQNEFLNSSSFLSNSQIIRSSNLNNTKATTVLISSPTRPEADKKLAKHKEHFQLFVSKESAQNSLNSDDEEEGEEEEDGDGDQDAPCPRSSSSRKSSRSSKFIDIDNPSSTPKLPKMNPNTTPWRKLRPQSTYLTRDTPAVPTTNSNSVDFIQSLFDHNPNALNGGPTSISHSTSAGSDGTSSTTAHSSYELEDLRKQITNYKVQQRLLTELIRSIIKSSGTGDDIKNEIMSRLEKENDLLLNERISLQKDLKNKLPSSSSSSSSVDESKYNEKVKEVLDLKNDLISTKEMNDELSSYAEELKKQLSSKDDQLNNVNYEKSIWEKLINDILSLLLSFLDGDSATAIIQARDKSKSIDTKLKVITLAVNEFLEKYEKLLNNLDRIPSVTPGIVNAENLIPHDLKLKLQERIQNSEQIEHDLKDLFMQQSGSFRAITSEYESLKLQFNENLHFVASLKKLLADKRAKISELTSRIFDLETQLAEMMEIQESNSQEKETHLLRNRLKLIKLNHSKELQRYKDEITSLKYQVEELKGQNEDKRLTDQLLKKQREITDLNNEIVSLNHQLSRASNNDNTIDNLKSLLHTTKNENDQLHRDVNNLKQMLNEAKDELLSNERDYKKKLEHAAKELNSAVTKQRQFAAEKSKLTFALEDANREKSTLALNNSSLNEKVTRLSYQVSSLSSYELGFNSLFQLQVSSLKNLLGYFTNVLEDSSVIQAEQKIKKLLDSNLEFEQIHSIIRSLLAYFENATRSLIEDHSELLIRYNQEIVESDSSSLKEEIAKLTEELEWCYANGNFNSVRPDDGTSPRTKLRIEDLEKKRKAEREKRKQEHDAFSHKIKSLEQENTELKEKLKQLSK